MRFLIDAQLPPLLADWLTGNGHEAVHVASVALGDAEDAAIWDRAVADDAVLLTKDEDFVAIRQRAGTGPAVCWLRIGNVTNPTLIGWFSKVWPSLQAALERGETLIEVR